MLHIYIYLASRGSEEQVLKQVSHFCYISFPSCCLIDELFFSSPLYGDFILSLLFPPLFIFFYIVFTHILPLTYTYISHTQSLYWEYSYSTRLYPYFLKESSQFFLALIQ